MFTHYDNTSFSMRLLISLHMIAMLSSIQKIEILFEYILKNTCTKFLEFSKKYIRINNVLT